MENRKKLLTLFAGLFVFNTEISAAQTSGENPIANAELYSVRTKSSIRYSFYEDDAGSSNGAGFLVDRSMGWILTNAHVSGRGTGDIEVSFKSEPFIAAKLVYVDTELDAAVIKVDQKDIPKNATEAPLQCETSELSGQEVAAFGHPHGLSYSASRGIVSKVRYYNGRDWIQIDAAINPGNSGGPLINLGNGKVIGINAMALKDTEGLNFAVPIMPICKILNLLKERKNPSPPKLLMNFTKNSQSEEYLIIGPAAHFEKLPDGLKIGDHLTHVDGQEVATPTEVNTILRGLNQEVEITIKRDEKRIKKSIYVSPQELVTKRKYVLADGALISFDPFPERRRESGFLTVHSVRAGSYAERTGWEQYSVLIAIDGIEPKSLEQVKEMLSGDETKKVTLRTWSNRDTTLYDYDEIDYWPYNVEIKTNSQEVSD